MVKSRNVLTTGQVSKICNVAPRTVSKWFDSGQLGGYRIPGSRDRRIPKSELLRFMKEHNIPLDSIGRARPGILIVACGGSASHLYEILTERGGYDVALAESAFEAGAF